MMMKAASYIMVVTLVLSCSAYAGSSTTGRQQTTALIVSGISKDPGDQAARTQAVDSLREYLLQRMKVDPRRLVVLAGSGAEGATAERVRAAIDTFASTVRSEDRFVFYYLGQANAVGEDLRLNLPGPDITQNDLAEQLKAIRANTQLIVLDCPCAGTATKALTGDNRIIVCASMATQPYGTRFTTHFVQALTGPETDADSDGRITLLEAFTAASRDIEQWYRQKSILPTETPCLEDDGDGVPGERPWKYQTDGGDGAKAAAFTFEEKR
jgi:hypothetical protein